MDEYAFTDKKEMLQFVRDMVAVSEDIGTPLKEMSVMVYHADGCNSEPCGCALSYGVDLNQTLEF